MIFPLAIIIIFFTSILSVTASSYLSIFGFIPDLLFIEIVIFSVTENYKRFLIYNFIAAIFYGLLSNLPLTATLPSFFISISLSNIFFRYYFGGFNYFVIVIYSILALMVFKILEISFLYFENYQLLSSLLNIMTLKLVLFQIIYNSFLIILIFHILRKLKITNQTFR